MRGPMKRRIFVARPRLDCSFKPGPVPDIEGPPRNTILTKFGHFIDGIASHHREAGDDVTVVRKPLWAFEFAEMEAVCRDHDRVYFPHKLKHQFPIGDNAVFYKNAPLADYFTVDANGWGASLSFLPPPRLAGPDADALFERLRVRIANNESIFEQPQASAAPVESAYDLFVCQVPHDETIRFHSNVSVEQALSVVLEYAQHTKRIVVVKGHPANPGSMAPLKALTQTCAMAKWVDDISIHTCMAGADKVFLVNSGSGMEALLHRKPVIRFGRAEYDSVTPQSAPDMNTLIEVASRPCDLTAYPAFIYGYLRHCIHLDTPQDYARVLEGLTIRAQSHKA